MNYQHFFESLPNPFIVFAANDPEFTIIAENQAHAKIALVEPKDTIGKHIFDAFPDNSEKYKKTGVSDLLVSIRKVIKTGELDVMPILNYDLRDKHGKFVKRWWRVTHHPGFDANGKVSYVYQATEDISNELRIKSKFDLAKSQLDSALAIGLVSTWSWEIDSDIVIADKNLAKSFGISAKLAATGLPLEVFINSIHASDRDRIVAAIQTSIKNDSEYEQEYRTVDSAGKTRWVIARGRLEYDSESDSKYLLGVVVDITARKNAERELNRSKHMFDALFQSTVMSIALATMDGAVLQANKTFLKTFGYKQSDLKTGLHSKVLTPAKSRGATNKLYDSLRLTGEAQPMEKEYIRKNDTLIPMLVGAVMLPGSDNEFIAYMLDISENKQLKALNQAKDEFIGMASHQLRTPATVVKQYVSLLKTGFAGELNEQQQSFADKAYESNERQLRIVNDLLKTAQIDSDSYILNKHRISPKVLAERAVEEMKEVIHNKGQTIQIHDTAGDAQIYADDVEMNLALVNLIENACKYSHNDTAITVETSIHEDTAIISITDQGVGIAEADISRVFNKFTRADNELSDTVSGSGLGLYWVQRIVKMHGGLITVKTKPNKGTSFVVHLPYEQ